MKSSSILVLAAVILFTSLASAINIKVDADLYDNGADISTAFPGVTLSTTASRWNGIDGKVYARIPQNPSFASTGLKVFGNSASGTNNYGVPDNETWWRANTNGQPFTADKYFRFRADFNQPANYVAIDIIGNSPTAHAGMLEAYRSNGSMLAYITTPDLNYGESYRAVINRPSFDIAYIIASGTEGWDAHLDNLEVNIIPEPATLLLLGLGGLMLRNRRKQ
jgi:hypothetical protein